MSSADFNFFADAKNNNQNSSAETTEPTFNFFADANTKTSLSNKQEEPIVKESYDVKPVHALTTEPTSPTAEVETDEEWKNVYKPSEGKHGTMFLCTDGGSRCSESLAATGWVLYNRNWNLVHGQGKILTSGTNNDAEMLASLEGIKYVMSTKKNMRIIHLTDSKLVEGGLTGNSKLNAERHKSIRKSILSLQGKNGNYILSYQLPRESNSGADRMCNLSMDAGEDTYQFYIPPEDIEEDRQKTRQYVEKNLISKIMHYGEASMMIHNRRYYNVMTELVFKHTPNQPSYPTPGGKIHVKNVEGHKNVTGFETDTSPKIVNGIERVIPPEAMEKLRKECLKHNVKWHDSAFSKTKYIDGCPVDDIALLSSLCRSIGNDVGTIIKWYRNQNADDNRPNKHLRPDLYEKHLSNYPGLADLCKVASDGFQSRVNNFEPPRPFTKNHQSAIQRSEAVQKKTSERVNDGENTDP